MTFQKLSVKELWHSSQIFALTCTFKKEALCSMKLEQLHRGAHRKTMAEQKRMSFPPNKSYDFASNAHNNPNNLGHMNTLPKPITKALKASTISPSNPSHNGKDDTFWVTITSIARTTAIFLSAWQRQRHLLLDHTEFTKMTWIGSCSSHRTQQFNK